MDADLIFMQKLNGLPSIKALPVGLCNYTSNVVNIDNNGRIFICLCEQWLPWSIGHIMDFESLDDIWNHPKAIDIRSEQDAGTYKYCNISTCGASKSNIRHIQGIQIYLGFDNSCQLFCPSCRQEQIYERDYEYKLPWAERVISWVRKRSNPERINILIGAHGDPFASGLYKKVMQELSVLPVRFQLRTNGLLINKHLLSTIDILNGLTELEISIDAGTAKTYEQVRRPAKWTSLIENLEYLKSLRHTHKFDVTANFVIQRANVADMLDFFNLCMLYNMKPVYTLLQDWNTFCYHDEAVHLPTHPNHSKFLEMISLPSLVPYMKIGDRFDL